MNHFAIRSKSLRLGDRPFTCPGLGDRVHSVLLAYLYSPIEPVTIHITVDKWSIANGVMSDKKCKSWLEITDLFPNNIIIQPHPIENIPDVKWVDYLRNLGYDNVTTYHYKDAFNMHPNDFEIGEDASVWLQTLPMLKAEHYNINLPKDFITTQFDSTDKQRSISLLQQTTITNKYRAEGFDCIELTGDMSLKQIAYILSKAKYHVGIDSGMLHMAMLYLPYNRIHLYNNGYKSHHLLRAVRNGSLLNRGL